MTNRNGIVAVIVSITLSWVPQLGAAGDSELITKPSKYSVPDTIERFEVVVKGERVGRLYQAGSCRRRGKGRASIATADRRPVR